MIIDDLNRRLADKELSLELSSKAVDFIVENAYDPIYGARPLRRAIVSKVEDVDESVKKYEPKKALYVNPSYYYYEEIIKLLPKVMKEKFVASFEIGYDLKEILEDILKRTKFNIKIKYEFIKELDGKNFTADFRVTSGKGDFDLIKVNLYDYSNVENFITVSLENVGGNLYLSVNGEDKVNTGLAFVGSVKVFSLNIANKVLNLYNTYITINKYSNGKTFNGFADFIYMDVEILGKKGLAEVQLIKLNQQVFTNVQYDVTSPNVFFAGDYGGEVKINAEVDILPVYAIDVLDPYSEMTFSMTMPRPSMVAPALTAREISPCRAQPLARKSSMIRRWSSAFKNFLETMT